MNVTRTVTGITIGLLILAGVIIFSFRKKIASSPKADKLGIEQTWELPSKLDEISGMVFLDEDRLVCIQDEDGIIFIYNLATKKIEREIEFAESGDYEGIAFANTTIFVVTAGGKLLKVEKYHRDPTVSVYNTFLTSKNDVESLFFDKRKNQLLLSSKEKDPNSDDYKGIYSFNLNTSKLESEPAYKINLNNKVFDRLDEKKATNRFKPTDIAIDPATGEIYSVEGTNPKLLVMDKNANAKKLYVLNKKEFPQPEGIAFSPDGDLYISSEGNPGLIHKISLKQ